MASQNSETASNTFSASENELQEYSEISESNQSLNNTKRKHTSGKKQNDLHYSKESCEQLLTEMRSWKRRAKPYDLSYNSACEIPIKWWLSLNTDDD
ncbi:9910_t:CDS:2 [Racocetra fulgida]|uniref:9910_t:CDS:1 n=1 Tax=Racocetra fulgida TaxID=60492 RepID=A0A9N8ZLW3_9GLOM|nr:9910_t:CDS:2 [Racocetra fulgida]